MGWGLNCLCCGHGVSAYFWEIWHYREGLSQVVYDIDTCGAGDHIKKRIGNLNGAIDYTLDFPEPSVVNTMQTQWSIFSGFLS